MATSDPNGGLPDHELSHRGRSANDASSETETIVRRNATIRIYRDRSPAVVVKSYQHKYSVEGEAAAYQDLARVTAEIPGIRTPIVYDTSIEENRLTLEFIAGTDLVAHFKRDGIKVLEDVRDRIVELCVRSQDSNFKFDLAPEHFLQDGSTGDWAVIDPISENMPLRHFSFIVFTVGLIKCFATRLRPWNVLAYRRCWLGYYREYLTASQTDRTHLNSEFAQFINRVIEWNLQVYDNESWMLRLLRVVVLVPMWSLIRIPFRWQLIR